MARKIVVTQYISLDGVIQDPVGMENSGLGDWTGPHSRGSQGDRLKHEELYGSDMLLLGRITYDAFAAVWPSVKDEAGFADRINTMPKFVVSTTLKSAQWNNTTVISRDFAGKVRGLKAAEGGDILIYGSARLVHELMWEGLIDQFNLMVYPVVLGRGTKLFPENFPANLALEECRELGDGIVWLRYRAISQ